MTICLIVLVVVEGIVLVGLAAMWLANVGVLGQRAEDWLRRQML